MALRSMTGYGQAEAATEGGASYRVEIRGVNNRFLDVQTRLPKSLMSLEQKVKARVAAELARGYVTLTVSGGGAGAELRLTWDRAAVEAYLRIFREVIAEQGLEGGVTLRDLLQFSDFVKAETAGLSEEEVWTGLEPVVAAALREFQAARAREGRHTEREVRAALKAMGATLKRIEARAPRRVREYGKALRARVRQLVTGAGVDDGRIATEIAIMADKLDIAEECARLRGHLEAFDATLGADEAAGKRLGFLLQEMNREANTICSKANDAGIAQAGIVLKEHIERIREQLQNVE
jgi:uncharacterized protein (TIGR00255 family)